MSKDEPSVAEDAGVEVADDVCSLTLARRLAALLDRDPATLREGDPLPHGWHVLLFNPPTRQAELRADGAAHLGLTLPDLDLPRLMLGGRTVEFTGEIRIGDPVRRTSRQGPVSLKEGRSGRFALIEVEHRITLLDDPQTVLVETNSYVLRAADAGGEGRSQPARRDLSDATLVRTIVPDEAMLFRYSAITDNPHRIHYDLAYARDAEGYPALVVNGSIPTMLLLEMFRSVAGREPERLTSRNLAPMLCRTPLTLALTAEPDRWRLQAYDPAGNATLEATAW